MSDATYTVILDEQPDVVATFQEGDSTISVVVDLPSAGALGVPGPPGPPGATFQHVQAVAAETWTINHNLGVYPNISAMDHQNEVVYGDVVHLNVNTAEIHFSAQISGRAVAS